MALAGQQIAWAAPALAQAGAGCPPGKAIRARTRFVKSRGSALKRKKGEFVAGSDLPEPITAEDLDAFLEAGFRYGSGEKWLICLKCGKRSSTEKGYGCKHVEEWAWGLTPLGGTPGGEDTKSK